MESRRGYDRYGNRLSQALTGGQGFNTNVTVDATTNRIQETGFAYDAAGNLISDPVHNYFYDAEGRMTNVDARFSYGYDNGMRRVSKTDGNTGTTTNYVYSGGKVIAEYVNGVLTTEYVYAGAQLVATLDGSGNRTYHYADQLSTRVETDASANVTRTYGHFPFGESWYETGTPDKWKFTSYERDAETGNDYAMAREYASTYGRFMQPDPAAPVLSNPGSLDRYSYVFNDPATLNDPSGMFPPIPPPGWGDPYVGLGLDALFGGIDGRGGHSPLQDVGESGGCVQATKAQQVTVFAALFYARLSGETVGVGIGASGGAGALLGVAGTGVPPNCREP